MIIIPVFPLKTGSLKRLLTLAAPSAASSGALPAPGLHGNKSVGELHTLSENNVLRLDFVATTDKDTVVNLTQHSYFNLRGQGDVGGHIVKISADRFTPVDDTLIPTSDLRPVAGTPFDFCRPMAIGARIAAQDEQLRFANGYDHNNLGRLTAARSNTGSRRDRDR